jgi:threonine aldolase
VAGVAPVQTNIVVFRLVDPAREDAFIGGLLDRGVRSISLGQGRLRMVAHLDVSRQEIDQVCDILADLRI